MAAEFGAAPPRSETHEKVGTLIHSYIELEDARPDGKERDAVCDYAVAVARFFARADATGKEEAAARALKAEEWARLKGRPAAEVQDAMAAVDERARRNVRDAGDRAEKETEAALARAGSETFMRRVMDAWFQMDAFLRGQ